MIHPACRKHFDEFVKAIMLRGEMDEAVFQLIERTGRDFRYVSNAVSYAMSAQNAKIQALLKELLNCECPIYFEEWEKEKGRGEGRGR